MRIDVITLNAVPNYGSVLQAFATQEILKQYGCEVYIINYVREDVKPLNLMKSWCGNNIIKKIIMYPTLKRWKKVFGDFNKLYLNLTDSIYTTEKDFEKYPLEADAYCTGSDQVWNSKWNKGIILPLYLSFIPKEKFKFAYAASFGNEVISKSEKEATVNYIKQYNFISVREDYAKEILENQYGYKNVVHIMDPTLAMPADFWRKYATQKKLKEEYILIYNLNRSKEFDNYAKNLSKKTGLKLVRFCTRYDQFYRIGKSILIPEIFDFISLIDNAKYVLTDSFHATAFSMNLNTEPICIYPKNFGGRIKSFLSMTRSLHRHVKDYNDYEVINRPVNFKVVNEILDNERKKVYKFLDIVINEINEKKE